MTNKTSIQVEAQFDSSKVEQKLNVLGQKVAQANKVQFNPVSVKSSEELAKIIKQFEVFKKIQGDLNKRMKSTGQDGAGLLDVDWEKLYPDKNSRARQMRKAFEYSTGSAMQSAPGGGPPGHGGGPSWGGMAAQVGGAGLRATGAAGGVAASAIGTGASAGVGAGLMGLMGGMLALGVSKIVGSVMDKVDQAEGNAIAMDKLKRTLGDVNVSFNALKTVVHSGADNLKLTYDEAGKLTSQFVKLGNISGDKFSTLGGELGVGVGMSRAFGMDPSQGVGVMGQMRGIGVTSNTQDSKRFALLIGETIGKSNAFAKSEEVMDALASYTTSQTRNNMGAANTAGYGGMFSAMVGSGIPGLDPSGAGALLGRINASLSAGGAKGEASQFFSGSVGASMGLNTYQTKMLRDGGAFATNDSMFGAGSAYARYKGQTGPRGSATWMQSSMDRLRKQYGEGTDELADATSNHLGIGINQAMAMLSLKPNQMGELSKYADLTKLSGSGIGNLSKAQFGSAADRQGLASMYLGRTGADAISKEDRQRINGAGSDDQLKAVLSEIAGKYDQERTQGSDIRDSKAALENIKTNLADQLLPAVNAMRAGIIYMAGGGKMSQSDIMKKVAELDSRDKENVIKQNTKGAISDAYGEQDAVGKKHKDALEDLRKNRSKMSPEQIEAAQAEIARLFAEKAHKEEETRNRVIKLREKQEELLKQEVDSLADTIKKINYPGTVSASETTGSLPPSVAASAPSSGGTGGSGGAGASLDTSSLDDKIAAAERKNGLPAGVLKSVMQQETGGNQDYINDPAKYHYGLNSEGRRVAGHTGKISTAFGPFGILESTGRRPGYGVAPLQDKSIDEQIRFSSEYLAARSKSAGGIEGGLAGYGEGARYSNSVMSRMKRAGTPLPSGASKTPLPPGAGGGGGRGSVNPAHITADDITVHVVDANGRPVAKPQQIKTQVKRPAPFGEQQTAHGGFGAY